MSVVKDAKKIMPNSEIALWSWGHWHVSGFVGSVWDGEPGGVGRTLSGSTLVQIYFFI